MLPGLGQSKKQEIATGTSRCLSLARRRRGLCWRKPAIAVPSLNKLPLVIDAVISAIRAGELDAQLAHASKQTAPKRKAALRGNWLGERRRHNTSLPQCQKILTVYATNLRNKLTLLTQPTSRIWINDEGESAETNQVCAASRRFVSKR